MNKIVVSVVINCYNGEKYLKQAIDSVLNQSFSDFELIFWDNQSTDNSASIVLSYDDNRIKYFFSDSHDILGMARNKAIEKSLGEFITFLDCDDYWLPNKLKSQIEIMNSGDYVLSYAGVLIVDNNMNEIVNLYPAHLNGYRFNDLLGNFDINMATPIIRRQSLLDYGLNFDSQIYASEEVNLFLKLAYYGNISSSSETLAVIRSGYNGLTQKSLKFWYKDLETTIKQLLSIDNEIPIKFPDGYNKINAKMNYYKSRYYLNSKQYINTIFSAYKSAKLSKKYFLYFLLTLVPFLIRYFLYLYEQKSMRWFIWRLRN
jgi:glycosyltransferase involved in cell wall biosynthesis